MWIEFLQRGAYDYLAKPLDRKELRRIVTNALERHRSAKSYFLNLQAHRQVYLRNIVFSVYGLPHSKDASFLGDLGEPS